MISSIPHFPLLLGVTVALPRSVFLPGVIGNVQLFLGTKVLFSGTDSHLVYDWMITRMKLIFYLHLLNSQGRMLINPGFSKLSRVSQSLKIYKLKSFLGWPDLQLFLRASICLPALWPRSENYFLYGSLQFFQYCICSGEFLTCSIW